MEYQIHLYAPKTGRMTPAMLEWLMQYGQSTDQPEAFWPVRKLNPRALARLLLQLDPTLIAERGEYNSVELIYPMRELNIRLYLHERGVIVTFPYMGSTLVRIVLGICYVYIRFLYEQAGFWSFDPQLGVLSYADDYQSIDETARMMDDLLPRLLQG